VIEIWCLMGHLTNHMRRLKLIYKLAKKILTFNGPDGLIENDVYICLRALDACEYYDPPKGDSKHICDGGFEPLSKQDVDAALCATTYCSRWDGGIIKALTKPLETNYQVRKQQP
jgi:hypothetical protein